MLRTLELYVIDVNIFEGNLINEYVFNLSTR